MTLVRFGSGFIYARINLNLYMEMAGQKKKYGLGAGGSAPIFAIGCKVGCGLGRIDLLKGSEIVM